MSAAGTTSVAPPVVSAADSDKAPGQRSLPWLMSAPAILLCTVMLLVPLVLTFVLSFNAYDAETGPKAGTFTLEHYAAVLTDPYYYGIFWRTLWISGLVTLICIVVGAPEAWILNRMRKPWRSIMLLVVLAPLMISVVVRAFGWSMLLGPEGLINGTLVALGFAKVKLLYTETAIVIALVHVLSLIHI